MTEIQVEVTQEDLDTLIARNPLVKEMLHGYSLQRTVEEQAAEIRRLNEEVERVNGDLKSVYSGGKNDAKSG